MAVKYEVSVTAIGKLARKFLETNSSIILLDEEHTPISPRWSLSTHQAI